MNNIPPCYSAFNMPAQSYQPEKKKQNKIGVLPYVAASALFGIPLGFITSSRQYNKGIRHINDEILMKIKADDLKRNRKLYSAAFMVTGLFLSGLYNIIKARHDKKTDPEKSKKNERIWRNITLPIIASQPPALALALIKERREIKLVDEQTQIAGKFESLKKWKAEYKKYKNIRPFFSPEWTPKKHRIFKIGETFKEQFKTCYKLLYGTILAAAGIITCTAAQYIKEKKNANNAI